MDYVATVLEIVKYTLPSLIVLASSYLIVKNFLISQNQRKQIAVFKEGQEITLRLKLQAYERLIVFIERMSMRNLIPRIYDSSMTVRDMQQSIIINIKAEFDHNLSQQIYVSKNVWETVKNVKEQELKMVNSLATTLNPDAPARDLHARILEVTSQTEELPTDMALKIINEEVKMVLSYGSI
jgi:hypothetical protein